MRRLRLKQKRLRQQRSISTNIKKMILKKIIRSESKNFDDFSDDAEVFLSDDETEAVEETEAETEETEAAEETQAQ